MSKFFIILIKGVVGLIWFIATAVTAIILSPFVLASWISGKLNQNKNEDNENTSSDDSNY